MEKEKKILTTTRFVVVGCKWWDKVYGNTYNNAKIKDLKTGKVYYKGFAYGYGSNYFCDAIEYVQKFIDKKATYNQFYDAGSFYATKKESQNGLF